MERGRAESCMVSLRGLPMGGCAIAALSFVLRRANRTFHHRSVLSGAWLANAIAHAPKKGLDGAHGVWPFSILSTNCKKLTISSEKCLAFVKYDSENSLFFMEYQILTDRVCRLRPILSRRSKAMVLHWAKPSAESMEREFIPNHNSPWIKW